MGKTQKSTAEDIDYNNINDNRSGQSLYKTAIQILSGPAAF
jgi:hypothetical protein